MRASLFGDSGDDYTSDVFASVDDWVSAGADFFCAAEYDDAFVSTRCMAHE